MTPCRTTVAGTPRTVSVPPRLVLRDHSGHVGPVDGAWWPRTGDPATELHELVGAVSARLGRMVRIGFDWQQASPDRYAGRETPALGFMRLFGSGGVRLDLLVIPAHTRPEIAAAQMRWASGKQWRTRGSTASNRNDRMSAR